MQYEVLKQVQAVTSEGVRVMEPGQVIDLPPEKADRFIEAGTIRPVEQEQNGLVDLMASIWMQYFAPIKGIWPRGFVSTPEMREAEIHVELLQKSVLEGKATIGTFRQAVVAWADEARKSILH